MDDDKKGTLTQFQPFQFRSPELKAISLAQRVKDKASKERGSSSIEVGKGHDGRSSKDSNLLKKRHLHKQKTAADLPAMLVRDATSPKGLMKNTAFGNYKMSKVGIVDESILQKPSPVLLQSKDLDSRAPSKEFNKPLKTGSFGEKQRATSISFQMNPPSGVSPRSGNKVSGISGAVSVSGSSGQASRPIQNLKIPRIQAIMQEKENNLNQLEANIADLEAKQNKINAQINMLKNVKKGSSGKSLNLIKEHSIGQMEQTIEDLDKLQKKVESGRIKQQVKFGAEKKLMGSIRQASARSHQNDKLLRPAKKKKNNRLSQQADRKGSSASKRTSKASRRQRDDGSDSEAELDNALVASSKRGFLRHGRQESDQSTSKMNDTPSEQQMIDFDNPPSYSMNFGLKGAAPRPPSSESSSSLSQEESSSYLPSMRRGRNDGTSSDPSSSVEESKTSSQYTEQKESSGEEEGESEKSEEVFKEHPQEVFEQSMDVIMNNINNEKRVDVKKESSPSKKMSLIRRKSLTSLEDDLIGTDTVPMIDPSQMSTKDRQKFERMRYREHRQTWMFYPEDHYKMHWDLFINMILLFSCLSTPYNIAFGAVDEPLTWTIINFTIDGCFLIDIFIIFNSAYYDEEFLVIEDRKVIAREYLTSWFLIDILAIAPFDYFIASDNYGDLVRFARIGKISRLVKMTRLLRILKIVKQRSQLLKYLNEILKIGLGFERLVFFLILFFILCHLITCLWVIVTLFVDQESTSWIREYESLGPGELYVTSFYFTITTITTVGYGDITAENTVERGSSIVFMILGVMAFSFGTGSLSSILQNYDQANAKLQERISVLNRIYKDYYLPLDLYQRLKQAVKYDFNKDRNDINQFVEELPHKLKLEVSLYIHENTYKRIDIFKGRSSAFIAWICPLLKPQPYPENQYIFFEGDDVTNIQFLTGGKAGFVLPKYKNTTFINIDVGAHFGIIDIVGSVLQNKFELDNWIGHKDILKRQFTIMALRESEVLCLSIQDLYRMKNEFLEAYEKIFSDAYNRLRRALTLKLKAMKICGEKFDEALSSRSGGSSVDIDLNQEPANLTDQLQFTAQENMQLKAEEIDYQIQAIQLNKIDEESIEYTDTEGKGSEESQTEEAPTTDAKKAIGQGDYSANVTSSKPETKFAERKISEMNLRRSQTMQQLSQSQSQASHEHTPLLEHSELSQKKTMFDLNKTQGEAAFGPKKAIKRDFDENNFTFINKPRDDRLVELESKNIIREVAKLQKGGFSQSKNKSSQALNQISPYTNDESGAIGDHLPKALAHSPMLPQNDSMMKFFSDILKKMEDIDQRTQDNIDKINQRLDLLSPKSSEVPQAQPAAQKKISSSKAVASAALGNLSPPTKVRKEDSPIKTQISMRNYEELKDDSNFLNLNHPNGGRQRSNTKQYSRNRRTTEKQPERKRVEKRHSSNTLKRKEENSDSRRNSHVQAVDTQQQPQPVTQVPRMPTMPALNVVKQKSMSQMPSKEQLVEPLVTSMDTSPHQAHQLTQQRKTEQPTSTVSSVSPVKNRLLNIMQEEVKPSSQFFTSPKTSVKALPTHEDRTSDARSDSKPTRKRKKKKTEKELFFEGDGGGTRNYDRESEEKEKEAASSSELALEKYEKDPETPKSK